MFLGKRSGTVGNCLLRPTNALLEVLAKHGAKAMFFVDTTYCKRLAELKDAYPAAAEDFRQITAQLRQIAQQGHLLCHHIHPHWIDARYIPETNQWDLSDDTHYCVDSLTEEQKDALFRFSADFLREITGETSACYRAGGLCIEPLDSVLPMFGKYGITSDFSTVAPLGTEPFTFSTELKPDKNGTFSESPISLITIKGLWKIANGVFFRLSRGNAAYQKMGDGTASAPHGESSSTNRKRYMQMTMPISVELLNPVLLPLYKRIIRKHGFVQLLSHPKLLSPNSIKMLDRLLGF